MTKDGVAMMNQGCRGKGLDQALERMSVRFTVSEELDLHEEPYQRMTGVQVTILQDGTVDTYPGGDRREIIIQQEYGILVRDPHGISSCNKFQIFDVGINNRGDELFQVGLVTYFSLDLIRDKGLTRFTLGKQINQEINSDLVTTNWLVHSHVPKTIMWRSRIPNASGEASQVVENGRSRDGIGIYLLEEDEKTMLMVM